MCNTDITNAARLISECCIKNDCIKCPLFTYGNPIPHCIVRDSMPHEWADELDKKLELNDDMADIQKKITESGVEK